MLPFENPLFASNTTLSLTKGIQAPPEPPELVLQCILSFQSPAPFTQYRVVPVAAGSVMVKPELPSLSIPLTAIGVFGPSAARLDSSTLSISTTAPAVKINFPALTPLISVNPSQGSPPALKYLFMVFEPAILIFLFGAVISVSN
ncbi:hypothetical protein D3C86_699280 [compost metagenome]